MSQTAFSCLHSLSLHIKGSVKTNSFRNVAWLHEFKLCMHNRDTYPVSHLHLMGKNPPKHTTQTYNHNSTCMHTNAYTHMEIHRLTHKVPIRQIQFLEVRSFRSTGLCQTVSPIAKDMYSWRAGSVFRCWTVAGTVETRFRRVSAGSSFLSLEALQTGGEGQKKQAWELFTRWANTKPDSHRRTSSSTGKTGLNLTIDSALHLIQLF